MSKISRIQGVEDALLTAAENQMCTRDKSRARGVEVCVLFVECEMICWSEPVEKFEARRQLQEALTEVLHAVPTTIAGHYIYVPFRVRRRPLTRLPDTCFRPSRRCVEDAHLLQCPGIVCH